MTNFESEFYSQTIKPENEMKIEKTIEQFELMEGIAWRCICNIHYFQLTSTHSGKFWPVIQNALGETACLFWSHLFGNRDDDFHYSKFFSREDVRQTSEKFALESIKIRLFNSINMDQSEYETFWSEVKSCRDKFVAHRDSNRTGIIFPRINLCQKMTEELRDIFFELVCTWIDEYPNDVKIEGLKKYFRWYSNRSLEAKCKSDFKNGIIEVSEKLAKLTN